MPTTECYFCGRSAGKCDPGCPGLDKPESHRPVNGEYVCGVDFGYAGSEVTAIQVMRLEDDGGLVAVESLCLGTWPSAEERESQRRRLEAFIAEFALYEPSRGDA